MPAIAELPDIDQAIAALGAAEAAQGEIPAEPFVQEVEPTEQQPTPKADDGVTKPDSKPDDTRATAGDKKPDDAQKLETQKPGEKPPVKPKETGSAFKKNADRLEKTWKSVNERKVQLDTREQTLTQREQQIEQREQQLAVQRSKIERKYTPEQYEQASQNKAQAADQLDLQAEGLERRADKFEEEGKFNEAMQARAQAKQLRDNAIVERATARQMKDYAGHIRANPDKTLEQHQAQKAKELQHYTVEAAKMYPELAKSGSEFQKRTAEHLQVAATKYGLDANEYPAIMYFAAQMTALEQAAARVPTMEKELGELRAKVKDYEKLTAPGGGSEASTRIQTQQIKSDEDEGASLRDEAVRLS